MCSDMTPGITALEHQDWEDHEFLATITGTPFRWPT